MSQTSALRPCVDHFLRQASPHLQTYLDTMGGITNKNLFIERKAMPTKQYLFCRIEVRIPIVYDPALETAPVRGSPVPITDVSGRRGHDSGNTVKTTHDALYLAELVAAYNTNLLSAVTQELKAMQSLKDKQSPLPRTLTKLAEFKDGIVKFSKIINEILEYYSAFAVGIKIECPTVEDLKIAKEKVCGIKKRLKFEELRRLFEQHEFKTTTEHIFCAIMGLTNQVGSWFFYLDLKIKAHRETLQLLQKHFLYTEEQLRETSLLADYNRDSLLTALQKFGFTEERAETICKTIPDDCIALQSPCFWAVRFLTQSLLYHPLLDSLPDYIQKPERTDEWFTVDVSLNKRVEHDEEMNELSTWPVRMMNVTSSTSNQIVQDFIQAPMEDNSVYFFHGTSSVNAVSVVEYGITLTRGGKAQDFSSGEGFYLYEDFEKAKKWAQAGRGGHCAVIVFKVEKDMLDAEQMGGLDLHNDFNNWQKIVSLCRGQYRNKRLKEELFHGINFVYGPSCSNPARFEVATDLDKDDENVQLCIRDEDYAERFSSIKNIACVLFF